MRVLATPLIFLSLVLHGQIAMATPELCTWNSQEVVTDLSPVVRVDAGAISSSGVFIGKNLLAITRHGLQDSIEVEITFESEDCISATVSSYVIDAPDSDIIILQIDDLLAAKFDVNVPKLIALTEAELPFTAMAYGFPRQIYEETPIVIEEIKTSADTQPEIAYLKARSTADNKRKWLRNGYSGGALSNADLNELYGIPIVTGPNRDEFTAVSSAYLLKLLQDSHEPESLQFRAGSRIVKDECLAQEMMHQLQDGRPRAAINMFFRAGKPKSFLPLLEVTKCFFAVGDFDSGCSAYLDCVETTPPGIFSEIKIAQNIAYAAAAELYVLAPLPARQLNTHMIISNAGSALVPSVDYNDRAFQKPSGDVLARLEKLYPSLDTIAELQPDPKLARRLRLIRHGFDLILDEPPSTPPHIHQVEKDYENFFRDMQAKFNSKIHPRAHRQYAHLFPSKTFDIKATDTFIVNTILHLPEALVAPVVLSAGMARALRGDYRKGFHFYQIANAFRELSAVQFDDEDIVYLRTALVIRRIRDHREAEVAEPNPSATNDR